MNVMDDDCTNITIRKPKKMDQPCTGNIPDTHKSEASSSLSSSLIDLLPDLVRNAVKSELVSVSNKISSIETSINYMSKQYDEIITGLNKNTNDIKSLKDQNSTIRQDVEAQLKRIRSLEEENVKQQQWNRLQNIEIVGVPELKEENTVDIVKKIADKIGVSFLKDEIEFAHRVQAKRPVSATNGRAIIVRFRHRSTKDTMVAAARKHRGIKICDIGMGNEVNRNNNIYVNEHLTKYNKSLLKDCKTKAKEINFKFVWTKNCRIYVRRNETSPPISIITVQDLGKMV